MNRSVLYCFFLIVFIGEAHVQGYDDEEEEGQGVPANLPCTVHPTPGSDPYDVTTHCDPWGGPGASCADNRYIKFTYVEYGRRDDIYWDDLLNVPVCAYPGPVLQPVCTHPQALQIMKNQCDGLSYCNVGHATYQMNSPAYFFPDPCPGSQKSLFTKWECCERDCSKTRSVTVCEKKPRKIKCPCGYEISILWSSVFYGRQDASTCPSATPASTQSQCNFPSAAAKVNQLCDGHQSCVVEATSIPGMFWPDPCPGTSKYLKLDYKCCKQPEIPGCTAMIDKTLCEGDSLTLACEAGYELYVDNARWGRWNHSWCTSGNFQTSSCNDHWATTVARAECNRKSTCTINANPAFFDWNGSGGDPCPGTFKQVKVTYRCCQIPN